MAFTKQQLREMRENSAAGAARQRAKEQAALDKYLDRRNKEVAKAMSAKERDAAVIKAASDGDTIADIAEKFEMTEARVKKILQKTAGVIDAAELSTEERAEITAQAERDAGIYWESDYDPSEDEGEAHGPYEYGPFTDEPEPRNAADKPQEKPRYDVGEIAQRIKYMMRVAMMSLDLPDNLNVDFCIRDGLCELDVADNDESAMLTWRYSDEART